MIKISAPIKSYWAQSHNLSMQELLSSSSLKEQHRQEMIRWSEEKRNKDYGIFCREAVHMYNGIILVFLCNTRKITVKNKSKDDAD